MAKAIILIVEDEAIVAEDLAQKLNRLGYEVQGITATGEDAVMLARDEPPDLVLMDIRLQGRMDGVEAARAIRSECDLPIIYLTAHSDRATLQRAKMTEPFGYILKPFEELELHTHIEMALYKHQTERKLRLSEERFRLVLLNKPLVVFQQDRDLRYTWVHGSLPMFRPESIVDKTDSELQPPEFALPLNTLKHRVLETGVPERQEIQMSVNGASCWWDLTLEPWRNSKGVIIGISGAAMDITERKRAEEALRASRKDLESFNRSMVGRELRMVELKKEVDQLCVKFGQPSRYGYAPNANDKEG
jgi:PAS domain S-box-containing protein